MASSDYISREAAQKIICGWCGVCQNPTLHDLMRCDDICPQFAQIPAADVRPVVCCKDCVYAYPYGLEIKCTKHSGKADRLGEDATYSEFHDESWFCADGEERKHD
ncbi:MAG: hypothetical protein IKO00_15175 [Oscillospiraceae bacterium]|nr:hypothetical protein [Oscillospiraceae bacterium]